MTTKSFKIIDIYPISILHLGSDHRPVFADLALQTGFEKQAFEYRLPRGWRPDDKFNEERLGKLHNDTVTSFDE